MNTRRHKWLNGNLVIGILLVLLPALTSCGGATEEALMNAIEPAAAEAATQGMVGVRIVMARPEVFEKLERPPVVFDHLLHSESLAEEGCMVCHTADKKGNVSYEFVHRLKYRNRDALINAYHTKCNECHDRRNKKDIEAHGLGCGECHVDSLEYRTVSWHRPVFEHFHHVQAMEQGCETCHHASGKADGKLTYEKGNEVPCGNCHKEKDRGTISSLQKASHTGCIGCHERQYLAAESRMNPYECRNCHKPEVKLSEAELVAYHAGPYQKEPQTLLISYPDSILPPVSFDHEMHVEGKTCSKACHHFHVRTIVARDMRFVKTGDACQQCHTQANVPAMAGSISRDKTYHDPTSPSTCIGCHKKENKGPATCGECHTGPAAVVQPGETDREVTVHFPDIYFISRLAKKHMPVEFPHARHAKMIGNCDICHHYGPEKEKPTCNTCHGASPDFAKLTKPRLLSAYHRMCIGCHRNTGIGPVTCTRCHEDSEIESLAANFDQAMGTAKQ